MTLKGALGEFSVSGDINAEIVRATKVGVLDSLDPEIGLSKVEGALEPR